MRLILLGTSNAIPTAERVHTSVLVETSKNLLLFDCGSGVLHRFFQAGYDSAKITAIFLTHHHLDHNSDLLALLKANWLKGRTTMRVFGPAGTKSLFHKLVEVYAYLQGKFIVEVKELRDGDEIKLGNDIVRCVQVEHSTDALAYKVTSKGVSFVYSGDTEPCDSIAKLSKGVDLLIHECNFPTENMRGIHGHSNPLSIGETYGQLGIKRLVLVHLSPNIEKSKARVLKTIRRYYKGRIIIGKDLLIMEL